MDRINLWKKEKAPFYDEKIGQNIPGMVPYIIKNSKSCVIVCPGGGYAGKAEYEGEPIAFWLNSIGVSAFVLDYRVYPYRYPVPQIDARRAVKYARSLAEKYGYDEDKIGILGFSAGGHLAACTGLIGENFEGETKDDIDNKNGKADFMILCYPVISMTNSYHEGSKLNLVGENRIYDFEFLYNISLENRVEKNSPPAFVWTTTNDEAVPVLNSLALAAAYARKGAVCELHSYKSGVHGLGLAYDSEDAFEWTKSCERFLKNIGMK